MFGPDGPKCSRHVGPKFQCAPNAPEAPLIYLPVLGVEADPQVICE